MTPQIAADGRLLEKKWVNIIFLIVIHLLGFLGLLHLIFFGWQTATIVTLFLIYSFRAFSITGGYHRWGAHASYKAKPALQAFYLLFGASTFQQSLLEWCAQHIPHHTDEGTAQDRYSIKLGFWWAHCRCWCYKFTTNFDQTRIKELSANKLVALQHHYYLPLAIGSGIILPGLIGYLLGHFWAIFLGNFLCLVIGYHATWAVNSISHTLGSQPYTLRGKIVSTATRFMINALTSGGEGGDHAFHHRFIRDYRTGREWYNYDPTKWAIFLMSKIPYYPLTSDLVRTGKGIVLSALVKPRR